MLVTSLCIFMESGKTFTFKNVFNIVENENTLTFKYVAMSDGNEKYAVFQKANYIGRSTYTEKE